MPTSSQLTLFHVRGIRVGVDYSWFLVLFLAIIYLSGVYRDVLGHAVVAVRNGIPISDITLWLFGGVARMTRDTDSAGTEFKIAVAGPAVTLVIALLCSGIGIAIAGPDEFWQAMSAQQGVDISPALAVLTWLASINLLVLFFNLIPAFPLDGGRIARSIAWRLTGDRNRATRFAAGLGQGFSYVFIALGLLWVVSGNVIGGVWLALIGFILAQSARGYTMQSKFSSRIEGIRVADVMDAEPVAIPEATSVERAIDDYFLRYRWPWFPVVDGAERFRGLLVREAADAVPEPSRAEQTVGEVFELDAGGTLRVRDDAPLESLLGNDALRRLGGLAAVDADGRLRGVVTADQVGRALRDAIGAGAAPDPEPPPPPPPPPPPGHGV